MGAPPSPSVEGGRPIPDRPASPHPHLSLWTCLLGLAGAADKALDGKGQGQVLAKGGELARASGGLNCCPPPSF